MSSVRAQAVASTGDGPYDRAFFGHPRGLSTLFFTEMCAGAPDQAVDGRR